MILQYFGYFRGYGITNKLECCQDFCVCTFGLRRVWKTVMDAAAFSKPDGALLGS